MIALRYPTHQPEAECPTQRFKISIRWLVHCSSPSLALSAAANCSDPNSPSPADSSPLSPVFRVRAPELEKCTCKLISALVVTDVQCYVRARFRPAGLAGGLVHRQSLHATKLIFFNTVFSKGNRSQHSLNSPISWHLPDQFQAHSSHDARVTVEASWEANSLPFAWTGGMQG